MYSALADYYERHDLFRVSHSRMARYEILLRFLQEYTEMHSDSPESRRRNTAESPECRMTEYAEWLTLDLYLRDNVRNRPQFLPGEQGEFG